MSSEPSAQSDPLTDFRSNMESYSEYCHNRARHWKLIYWASRSALIFFGIMTSAEATVAIPFLAPVKPFFGFVVALITGLEVAFKPETKYKAHAVANDEYDQLRMKASFVRSGDSRKIEELQKEYAEINKRLRVAL